MSSHSLRFSPEDTDSQDVTLLNASSSRYEGDWPSIPHSHAFTELFYVRDGRGEFLLEDKIYPISKDDLIIVNPHINHTEISKGTPPLSYFTVGVEGVCFSFNDPRTILPADDPNRKYNGVLESPNAVNTPVHTL